MKKDSLKLLSLAFLGLIIASCSNPAKMAKYASQVSTECNPQVLEAVAGKIKATYTLKFPEQYFIKKAILEVTPVLVYQGGEAAGPVWTLQGEKVLENNTVVPFEAGATVNKDVVFDYVPGMEKASLELRATVYNRSRTKKIVYPVPFKIADGTNTTYMLVDLQGTPSFESDNYQKVIPETKEAQILYTINRAEVRNSELKSEEIKQFEQFLKDVENDQRRTLKSNDIIAYASPDGPMDLNTKLSDNRANTATNAFKKTITKKVDVSDAELKVSQVAEDWEGFQELVSQSNIPDKELILRVLSMYSDPAVREREIKNMSSVYKTLTDKILPELRRARFIANVDYQNWTDEELLQMINNNLEELDEEALLYTATLVKSDSQKEMLYKKAADKYNSDRAYNNLAALYLQQGKTADAKSALNKMSDKDASYYNNMGVVKMQEKNYSAAAQDFAKSNLPQAKQNLGALAILNGDYQQAVKDLSGSNSFNEALAYVLTNNLSNASAALKCRCPRSSYLRAVIAARQGNAAEANKQLDLAKKDAALASRAAMDIEFAKIN